MKAVYIVGAGRTPIGSFNGSLAGFSATKLGAIAIKGALERSKVSAADVNEVFMGNVISAGLGQAPATQASIYAGIPNTVPATTVNKVCASGMKAIMLGAQSIALGHNHVVVAGGMESMSNVPYYLDKARNGYRLGHGSITDGIIKDGLWDVYKDYHMGSAGELCAAEHKISREDQDNYAIESYQRAAKAVAEGKFKDEIIPVELPQKDGSVKVFDTDEDYNKVNLEKLKTLKAVFQKDGTITAANASNLNDGASAVILVSEEYLKKHNLKPLAVIRGFADAAQAPEWFTTTPAKALPLAFANAGVDQKNVDFYEINEAFSVVSIINNRLLNLDPSKVNVNGGAVAIGHPIGSSGARIVMTLMNVLKQNGGKIGAAGICNGGGGASAIVIENL